MGSQSCDGDAIGSGQGGAPGRDPTCEGRFKTSQHTAWWGAIFKPTKGVISLPINAIGQIAQQEQEQERKQVLGTFCSADESIVQPNFSILRRRKLMRLKYIPSIIISLLILLGLQACNFPGAVAPTPFTNVTPDLTLTAIFSPIAPTATLPPLVLTATALPTQAITNTAAPTHTPLIQATNTPLPLESTDTPIVPPATRVPARPSPSKTAVPTRTATFTPTLPPVTPTRAPGRRGAREKITIRLP